MSAIAIFQQSADSPKTCQELQAVTGPNSATLSATFSVAGQGSKVTPLTQEAGTDGTHE